MINYLTLTLINRLLNSNERYRRDLQFVRWEAFLPPQKNRDPNIATILEIYKSAVKASYCAVSITPCFNGKKPQKQALACKYDSFIGWLGVWSLRLMCGSVAALDGYARFGNLEREAQYLPIVVSLR